MSENSLREKAEVAGIKYSTVKRRIQLGWSEYDALTRPVQYHCSSVRNYYPDLYIGEIKESLDFYSAKLIEYIDFSHLKIQFDDGSIKYVSKQRWCSGSFNKFSYENGKTPQHSLNECAAYYYFSKIGFRQTEKYESKKFGFAHYETFDMYNPILKIVIEYDGMGHHYKKDHYKNLVCQKNNIRIYRLRERTCDVLDDGISFNYSELPSSWLSTKYEHILQALMERITSEYGLFNVNIDFKRDKKEIFKIYQEFHVPRPTKREKDRAALKLKNHERRQQRNSDILRYVLEHPEVTYPKIAEIFNVCEATVTRICKEADVHRYKKQSINQSSESNWFLKNT